MDIKRAKDALKNDPFVKHHKQWQAAINQMLKMGVRVDREGVIASDYHTAGGGSVPGAEKYGVLKANGGLGTVVSTRCYLADADFLVGLEGQAELLRRLDAALGDPVWPLFLGRKSYVPRVAVANAGCGGEASGGVGGAGGSGYVLLIWSDVQE